MLGISLAYLPTRSLDEASEAFRALQADFPLGACELHMEAIQFDAAFWYWDRSADRTVAEIRGRVEVMGVHLPYLDLNPISPNPRIARIALAAHRSAIGRAASLGADYVVFHARGRHGLEALRECEIECWRKVVSALTDAAAGHGIDFCFENADDARLIGEVARIVEADARTRVCLDIGHLFERIEGASAAERLAVRLSDRLLPGTLLRKGVPYYEAGGSLAPLADRIRCIHVHNHDGTGAHRPLAQGKADIGRIVRDFSDRALILEADYRHLDMGHVRADLASLEEWAR